MSHNSKLTSPELTYFFFKVEVLQIWGKSIAELIGGRFTLNIIERYDDLTHFIFLDRVNIFNSEKGMTF